MKKEAFFLIVFLFSFFGSYAQNYVPFPETDAQWISHAYYVEPQGKRGSYCSDSHIETVGDTIIGGVKYIKLQETKVEYPAYPYVCISTYVDTITSSFFGWMRNDTINKKVYFRKWNWSKDTLLYDFDLQIGDTVPTTYLFNNNSSSLYIIDTIKYTSIGGVNRKVFIYSRSINIYSDSLIEGVGSFFGRNGMKTYLTSQPGINYTFLCMSISGTKVYPPNGTCPIITSIDESSIKDLRINIIPNPVSSYFRVEKPNSLNIETAVLYDYAGRMVKRFLSNSENYDVKNVPPGIYIFRIRSKGYFYSEKIVIQ